jgi:dTDP-glucose 4,6-dehydratase
MRERLLVTGGAGFIGSEFVRQAVSRGFDIVVVDKLTYAGDLERLSEVNGRYRFYKIDTASIEEVQKVFDSENPDIVVHFAAESHVDRSLLEPYAFIDSNIKGTLNLLEASKVRNVKLFINVSTDEVYGDLGETGYFDEESPLRPNSPYSVSKAAQDMLGRAYFRSFGLPVITVRPSNNYGPWQYPEKLIPVVIYRALKGLPIPVYGKGENVREWLFVSDCVDGIFKAIEGGKPGEIYNIGSGEERQNIEVVKTICKILDELVPKGTPHESLITFVKDRPGHDFRYGLDSTKAQRELGFKAKTPFEEGIRITVEWYLKHQDWLENKVLQLKEFWAKNYGNI